MTYKNTKENNVHYKGKVWITKNPSSGSNICVDLGKEELYVIGYVDNVTDENVKAYIKANGWRIEDFL